MSNDQLAAWTDHDCTFPEVEILPADDDDEQGNLKAGMKVLAPCPSCGETPLDHMDWLQAHADEALAALDAAEPRRALFHWAPAARRKQILRYGLRPSMRCTTASGDASFKWPVVCFADSPSWAWALSGGMRWTPRGEWDCWQTAMDVLTDPVILPGPNRASGIYEVRTTHRVYKRDLWYVGTRTC